MKLTIEELQEVMAATSIHSAIEHAKTFYPEYPDEPKRPILPHKPSAAEARKYADEMEEYEKLKSNFKNVKGAYTRARNEVDTLIEQLIGEESGLNSIPEQYRTKVYGYAYEQGHSRGYSEIYNYLCSLVDIFTDN